MLTTVSANIRVRFQRLAWPVLLIVATASAHAQSVNGSTLASPARTAYGKVPLTFEANRGQTGSEVMFLSRAPGYTAFLTAGSMVLCLRAKAVVAAPTTTKEGLAATVQFALVGANQAASVRGEDQQVGKVNYFFGNDPTKWLTNVPTYAKVRYKDVYPGIDLLYYGNHRQLEYDFELEPGANPQQIRFEIRGARQINLDSDGNLVLKIGQEQLHFQAPTIYQALKGWRTPVQGGYVMTDSTHIAFQLAHYDSSKPLVIDPVLVYSTYLGGSGTEQPTGMAVDSAGSVYLAGYTNSVSFPTTTLGTPAQNAYHVFVTKLDPAGANLIYADYFGGNGQDYSAGLVLDSTNEVYVTGSTTSGNFPAVKPYQSQPLSQYTGFLSKISADGSSLLYSTYLGGSAFDVPTGIAINGLGQVHVTGYTTSQNFPVSNAYQSAAAPNQGGVYGVYGFLTKFSADGSSLIYSTYLSGNSVVSQTCGTSTCWPAPYNEVSALAMDANGNAYVAGTTNSNNFPVTPGAFQATNSTQQDALLGFVSKFTNAGVLDYSTYFYQSSGIPVSITGIAVDSTGSAYITGNAESDGTFPITSTNICDPNLYGWACGYAFVTKFDPTASTLLYSTFLGPNNYATPQAIAIDQTGNAYVAASTSNPVFQTVNAIEAYTNQADVLLAEIDPGATTQLFATYLGGSGNDTPVGIALDAANDIYVSGSTHSTDFPVTAGAFQGQFGGNADAFVTKIGNGSMPALSLNPTSVDFPAQAVGSSGQPQQVLVRNMSNLTLTIASISATGDFPQTDNCGASIAPLGSCTLSVVFAPTADGARTGAIIINDNGAGSPQQISLQGTGFGSPVVTLTPASMTFSPTQVGTSSAAQIIALTNSGNAALNINTIQVTGDFAQATNCPVVVAPGTGCSFSVTFTPSAGGSRSGALVISDTAAGSPQSVSLSGTGLSAVALSPAGLTFSATQVGVSGAAQTVTLTNQGNASLSIASVQVSGDYGQTNNCPGSLAAGSNCTFNIVFTPTAAGSRPGTLTINDSAMGSPQVVGLSGTGLDFSLTASSNTATVKAGAMANYTVTINPLGGAFSNPIKLACSGAPQNSTCSLSPTSTTPGANSATVTVSVSTTGSSAKAVPLVPPQQRPVYAIWIGCPGLGLLGMMVAGSGCGKRKWSYRLLVLAVIGTVLFMAGCAGGTGVSKQNKTPPGTYTINVTGTAGSLQHSIPLTLTVE